MGKHAYLIIAHNEPEVLKVLISLIDDIRNDIYLFIDSKADIKQFKEIKSNYSKLVFINRLDNRWGSLRQIEVEYLLFKAAYNNGPYIYYHLISGTDLPIKSQNYIHNFCDEKQKGKEFVGFVQMNETTKRDICFKTQYYHFCSNNFKSKRLKGFLAKVIWKGGIKIQRIIRYKRNHRIEIHKGTNWISITNEFCRYLIENEDFVMQEFKYTRCCDEMFVQSLLYQSQFYKNIYDKENENHSCLRKIDWTRGGPYTWTINDYDEIIHSDAFFARKFSSRDMDIVNMIKRYVSAL